MAAIQGGSYVHDWIRRSEDNLSMRSDTVIDIPADAHGRASPDEAVSLRFRNIRRSTMNPTKRNAAVGAGVALLLIGAVTFVGVYSSFGPGQEGSTSLAYSNPTGDLNSDQLQGDQPPLESSMTLSRGSKSLKTANGHIFVPERQKPHVPASQIAKREEPTTPASARTESDQVLSPNKNPAETGVSPGSVGLEDNGADVSTTAKPKAKKKKNKIQHHRSVLPANASYIAPISLLYQMKLIPSVQRINDVMKFTQCEHHFDDKKLFKGWRASLSLNSTIAQIKEDHNTFVGYGTNKNLAKLMAARYALMEIYPQNLTYTIDDEAVGEIKPYCDDNDDGN